MGCLRSLVLHQMLTVNGVKYIAGVPVVVLF